MHGRRIAAIAHDPGNARWLPRRHARITDTYKEQLNEDLLAFVQGRAEGATSSMTEGTAYF
jgi:hypothetical protein